MSTSSTYTIAILCDGLSPLPPPVPLVAMLSAAPFNSPAAPSPPWVSLPQPPPPVRPPAQSAVPPPRRPTRPPARPQLDLTSLGPLDRRLAEIMMRPELSAAAARRILLSRAGTPA